jgi:PAS domain S-box-containing protein
MRIAQTSTNEQAIGVRASLAILVVGCVLPLAIVAAFLIVDYYARERAQLVANTLNQTRTIMSIVDRDFGNTQAALQALGTSPRLLDGDLAGFHARALNVLRTMRADSIVLVAPSGELLLSTRRPFGQPLPQLARTPLLERIMATGQPGVSNLFKAPMGGQLIYTVGVPVRHGENIDMTLNATASPNHLMELLLEQKLPEGWRAAIIDGDGIIAARTHDAEKFIGKSASPTLRHQLSLADEGGFESTTLDGVPVFAVYSRSTASHWAVALGIPLDQLTAGLRRSLTWLIVATLAALGAGLGLAWRIGGGIARSVHALIGPAAKVALGEKLAIPPLRIREANELAHALETAADSVRTAQAGWREGEQRLALVAEAAHLGIWVRDLVKHDIWVSSTWRALLGFDADEPVTLAALLQRVHADDRATVQRVLQQAEQGGHYDIEYRVDLPHGGLRWIASHGSTECDAAGRPLLVRGVTLDITARKLSELDMQQKQREITHLARVATLGELSGALAHELNQPLTAILSNAQAAQRFLRQDQPDLGEVREILDDIVSEDQRAGEIIRRLRRLFDKRDTPRQPIVIHELVNEVLRILHNDLLNQGVTLSAKLDATDATVLADSVQLQQVLINLIVNACDALHGSRIKEVTVSTRLGGDDAIHISVRDCGPGIAGEALEKVFDPFFTTKDHGMGLGLSICRNIVAAHGGRLWAENNVDGGAIFHINIPVLVEQPA